MLENEKQLSDMSKEDLLIFIEKNLTKLLSNNSVIIDLYGKKKRYFESQDTRVMFKQFQELEKRFQNYAKYYDGELAKKKDKE